MLLRQLLLPTTVMLSFMISSAQAVVVTTVNEIAITGDSSTWVVGPGMQGGATAEIVSLTGLGGNLEGSAPLPTGAVKLTTGLDNNDRTEIGLFGNFGTVADLFDSSFSLSFDYYRQNEIGGNVFAGPSIKLAFLNDSCAAGVDCYFQAIFEPYLNGGVVDSLWTSVSIDISSGGFWQTGGFGLASDGGGCAPPCNTLQQLSDNANADFQGASLVGIAIGMGTYNQGVTAYVDDVNVSVGMFEASYDFEVAEVPEPAAIVTLALGLGLMSFRRYSAK